MPTLVGELFSNFGISTAGVAILALDGTITLAAGDGAKFPTPAAGQYFRVLIGTLTGAHEIVNCTARSGDVLTVARGQEGTSNQAWTVGTSVQASVTVASLVTMYGRIQTNPTNVKDKGAIGNGVVDDTAAIQAALADILAAGGGSLYIPAGTYLISGNLTIPSNCSVYGDGPRTILKFANATAPTYNIFYVNGVSNVEIAHLTIDGNRTGLTEPQIYYDRAMPVYITGGSDNIDIHDLFVHDSYFSGIMANWSTNLRIHGNRLKGGGDNLIYIRVLPVTPYNICSNVSVVGNICSNGDFSGIQFLATQFFTADGNVCYSNGPTSGQGDGIGSEGGSYGTINGNTVHDNGIQGINIRGTNEVGTNQGSSFIVVSNNIVYNHTSANGDAGGIGVSDVDTCLVTDNLLNNNNLGINITDVFNVGEKNITLRGNVIRNCTGYSIRISCANASDFLLENNTVTDFASDGIYSNQKVTVRGGLIARATVASKNGVYLAAGASNSNVEGVTIQNVSDSGVQVAGTGVANAVIKNCSFDNLPGALFNMGRALQEAPTNGPTYFLDNTVRNVTFQDYNFNNAASLAKGNYTERNGFYDTNSGSASIAVAAASVVVTHNLYTTPTRIILTPTADPQQRYWISARTATTFTVTLAAAAAVNPVTFDWRAMIWDN